MNKNVEYIKNRLSLRTPQYESLCILDDIADVILNKEINLKEKLDIIRSKYGVFNDFDRDFPSLCFALATGVGKTRLMGAFISYLYKEKGIKNFIVITPNMTVYKKLIQDFGDNSSKKYVFKGLSDFIYNDPHIITGDNYNKQTIGQLSLSDITINIFNIDKINKDEQTIKSLSEYIGESYFNYLSNMDDLVMLMDESHHYRALKGMQVLNELNPVLGLELTATPQIEKNSKTIKFSNIIYDYPLARAMQDGYIKEPSVATKKNFNTSNFKDFELDKIKLEDGILIHENTKTHIKEFALNNEMEVIKPFVLVVTKDTNHAKEIKEYMASDEFFDGKYKDKIIEIHSKTGKIEKDENIEQLILLEEPTNKIEIVIHVNMLKEGWDVNNLYTIIPLRTSASSTLTEQTMGRGLRLPYGKRTGVETVDRLTIVSHDKYQEIVEIANQENSIFKNRVREFDSEDLTKKEVVESKLDFNLEDNIVVNAMVNEVYNKMTEDKLINVNNKELLDKKEEIFDNVFNNNDEILKSDQNKELLNLNFEKVVNRMVDDVNKNIIYIPLITNSASTKMKAVYNDFDLATDKINLKSFDNSIKITHLGDGETIEITLNNKNEELNYKNLIIEKLVNYSDINYDESKDLLYKLVNQYMDKLKTYLSDNDLYNVVFNCSGEIAKDIYIQIQNNVSLEGVTIEEPIISGYSKIYNHNYTKIELDNICNYRDTIVPMDVPKKIFEGFKKAYHKYYKFDSKSEKDFAIILESSSNVLKWIRPTEKEFNIRWGKFNASYEPDFVVETTDTIFLVEIKKEKDVNTEEVQEKAKSARKYCEQATNYEKDRGNKAWKYLLIPHDQVKLEYGFERYL